MSVIENFINHAIQSETANDTVYRAPSGTAYKILIQPLNLNKERSVKIQVGDLGEPSKNLWVCLVLIMEDMEPTLYLIPSLDLADPGDFIFKYNKLNAPFEHLSNYEIKVFRNGMEKLSEYAFENMIGELA